MVLPSPRPTLLTLVFIIGLTSGCGGGTTITEGAPGSGAGGSGSGDQIATISVAVSPANVLVGGSITITGKTAPSNATGYLNFFDAVTGAEFPGAYLSGGTATVSTTLRSTVLPGTHSVYAQYSGDSTYLGGESTQNGVFFVALPASTCGLAGSALSFTSGSQTLTGGTYGVAAQGESALCATGSGTQLTLANPVVTDGLGIETSMNYDLAGTGAAILAYGSSEAVPSGGSISITGGSVEAGGLGVSALFASGLGSSITANGTAISTDWPVSLANEIPSDHAAGVARGGQMVLNNVTATNGAASDALLLVAGDGSSLTLNGGSYSSPTFGEWIEGSSTLTVNNAAISNSGYGLGILMTASTGDPLQPGAGTLSINGGTLAETDTFVPAITIKGLNGSGEAAGMSLVSLNGVSVSLPAPPNNSDFVKVTDCGIAVLSLTKQFLPGTVEVDAQSTLTVQLQSATKWTGAILGSGTANVSLDASSQWTLTGNSTVAGFSDAAGISGANVLNVIGNGFSLTYSASLNPALGGKTYQLVGGGTLVPAS